MEVSELKKLIKKSTSVLVLDNGEPSFVVVDYKVYKELTSEKEEKDVKINHNTNGNGNGFSHSHQESETLERLNREILALKHQIDMEEKGISGQAID